MARGIATRRTRARITEHRRVWVLGYGLFGLVGFFWGFGGEEGDSFLEEFWSFGLFATLGGRRGGNIWIWKEGEVQVDFMSKERKKKKNTFGGGEGFDGVEKSFFFFLFG